MKKLAFVAAAALAGACFADGDGITSANIVGYMTDSMKSSTTENKYNLMSVPFEGTDGNGISLNSINFAGRTIAVSSADADVVLFWKSDVQNYEKFYYYGYPGYEDILPPEWRAVSGDANYDTVHPEGIAPGTVFWYYSYKTATAVDKSMTSSGAIASDPYMTYTVTHKVGENTYYFIANPYPANVDISYDGGKVDWGNATYNLTSADSDVIMLWDAAKQNYEKYYFYGYKGYEKELTPTWKTVSGDAPFSDKYPSGLPAGTGFWYYARQATGADATQTIRFNSPLN